MPGGEFAASGILTDVESAVSGTEAREGVIEGAGGPGRENGVVADGGRIEASECDAGLIGQAFLKLRDRADGIDGAAIEPPIQRVADGAGESGAQRGEGELPSFATGLKEEAKKFWFELVGGIAKHPGGRVGQGHPVGGGAGQGGS